MLHGIGICKVEDEEFGTKGSEYITHGIIGADILIKEGLPREKIYADAIRGKNAELIAAAADAELMSFNYFSPAESMECNVYNKNGELIGRTPRRSPVYQNIAQDVADILHKDKVKIVIR